MEDADSVSKNGPIVVASTTQLAELIETAVARGLALHRVEPPSPLRHARLTIGEAADLLRCSTRQVRRLIAVGRLRASKLGQGGSSRVLIARSEIDRLVEEAST